ncbi:MAG: hypothetical protein UT05_C0010G0003 [Parcubacteria group bacterium GW2011_GWF2_38_76]|nr:MAG: hypothetical protein UT05_C0010G0003 [Parcubacteria group bacterium GW2011_GWF2_38_76]HBM45567.1 hypothetical protein [Patescibacteria group bacterium]
MDLFLVVFFLALVLFILLLGGLQIKELKKTEELLDNTFKTIILDTNVTDHQFWIIFLDTHYRYNCEKFFEIIKEKRPGIYDKIISMHNGDMI